jgi:hypothetical protein
MNYIADAKTKYFEDKDHYLAMRAAWARAVNNKDIQLRAEHFMFYNAVRGKEITAGFSETRNLKKLYHQMWANLGTYNAYNALKASLRWREHIIDQLVEIFDGTLTRETIVDVISVLPKVEQKFIYHGKKTFEEFVDTELVQNMINLQRKLRESTPVEPEFQEALYGNRNDRYITADVDQALWKSLDESAELVSEGENRE